VVSAHLRAHSNSRTSFRIAPASVSSVAQYDLGVFRPERPANGEDVFISNDRDIMASFATPDAADLDSLQVGSLDEP
jgi:hypothetical protein